MGAERGYSVMVIPEYFKELSETLGKAKAFLLHGSTKEGSFAGRSVAQRSGANVPIVQMYGNDR